MTNANASSKTQIAEAIENKFFEFSDGTFLRVVSTGHDEWGDIEVRVACSDSQADVLLCLQRGDANNGGVWAGSDLDPSSQDNLTEFFSQIGQEGDLSEFVDALKGYLSAAPGVDFIYYRICRITQCQGRYRTGSTLFRPDCGARATFGQHCH